MKTCCRCETEKSTTEFYKRSRAKDGLSSACKTCLSKDYTETRNKRKDHYIAVAKRNRDRLTAMWHDWKREQGCACCNETEPVCLELHHLDPNEKEFALSNSHTRSWKSMMEEAKKGVVVCSNCHKKIHAGLITMAL